MNRTKQPVIVPGRNTDPATDGLLVPLYIAAILCYHDARIISTEHGPDSHAAMALAKLASDQLMQAARTILRTREQAAP